jgi:hypothetical protein
VSKVYLGDSVYAEYIGFDICLTTENGFGATNKIILEPIVMRRLLNYYTAVAETKEDVF